ncbi:hypothetical protein D1872_266980 [compost metagenome]
MPVLLQADQRIFRPFHAHGRDIIQLGIDVPVRDKVLFRNRMGHRIAERSGRAVGIERVFNGLDFVLQVIFRLGDEILLAVGDPLMDGVYGAEINVTSKTGYKANSKHENGDENFVKHAPFVHWRCSFDRMVCVIIALT